MTRFRQLLVSCGIGAVLVLAPSVARAASAFVTVEQDFDGSTNVLRRVGGGLGVAFSSGAAPSVAGWRFIGWTVSSAPETVLRDLWGRAFDVVSVKIYEETTFTAHYVAADRDSDGDGLADGEELYWYGSRTPTSATDSDGDGLTFAAELENGTNPHFPDAETDAENGRFANGVVYDGRDGVVYNPMSYPVCTFRSEPEGALFATYSEVVAPGTALSSPVCATDGGFAYWRLGGEAQRDVFGRARDGLTLTQVSNDLIVVAVVETNALKRASLYWYGLADVAADSDTDGDGLTFAEELELGTNPLFADEAGSEEGVVADGRDDVLYNPHGWRPYVVRADDGKLFSEYSDYVAPGTRVTTPALDADSSDFAGWSVDGVALRDAFGRALDAASFIVSATGTVVVAHAESLAATRAELYWYGRTDVALDSDTDGDGKTLAEEIAEGTNPLFADSDADGGVEFDGLDDVELNVQFYERVNGFVLDGVNQQIDTGTQIWPVVADVNGDGLWDLIVVSATTTNVFVNVGSKGNPQFAKCGSVGADGLGGPHIDLDMNSTAKLAGMMLDVAPVGALSATTNGATMLVSDEEGRIWYYSSTAIDGNREQSIAGESYSLQHKVWGGSYAGFANGLMLAAVDWEDDGDLDCLCGTAEGKLMLLRDPKVGRPTGLVAEAGVDNVKLEWEPNEQSSVRGYRVYRGAVDGNREQSSAIDSTAIDSNRVLSTAVEYTPLASPSLPTYRDLNLAPATYGYKVSALSRFYTAGNSTPTEIESEASEPVVATVGGECVPLYWLEPLCRWDGKVIWRLAISNSMNFVANNFVVRRAYDSASLGFVRVEASELGRDMVATTSDAEGCVTLTLNGAAQPGRGVLFTFVFENRNGAHYDVLGDLDGNGVLANRARSHKAGDEGDDLKVMTKIVKTKTLKLVPKRADDETAKAQIAYWIRVGDFNGDGKLDEKDWAPFKAAFEEATK